MATSSESSSAALLAHAGVQRIPSDKLELFQRRDFLDSSLCDDLIALIEAHRRPSTIADDNGDAYFRTSETCDLCADEPAVQAVEKKLAQLSGIDPVYGEPLQGQRYAVGQEFKAHCDWFNPGGQDYEKYCSGQRSWTYMIYLNTVEVGGATRFKAIKKIIQPEMGKLLAWNNRRPDGTPNPSTIHHGMKVRKGMKYVLTKWYREKPWR